jgi:hypothetical protein
MEWKGKGRGNAGEEGKWICHKICQKLVFSGKSLQVSSSRYNSGEGMESLITPINMGISCGLPVNLNRAWTKCPKPWP